MAEITDISILYVEDQEEIRFSMARILSRKYKTIYTAANGKEGFDLFQKHHPDIVLTDIRMPVMDGLSMACKIKEIRSDAHIILTTAHNDMDFFLESINTGISQYILKPIDKEILFNSLEKCSKEIYKNRELEEKNQLLSLAYIHLKKREEELEYSLKKTNALKEIITESEQKFQQLAGHIQDVFWLRTAEKTLYINNAFENIFGQPNDIAYNNPDYLFSLLHPEDLEKFGVENLKKLLSAKEKTDLEIRICRPDGAIRWLWIRTFPIDNAHSKPERSAGIISDITDSKELELQSEQNQTWLRTTLSSIADGVIATDNNGKILFINKVALQLLKVSIEQTLSKPIDELFHIVNEKTQQKIDNPVWKVLATEKTYSLPKNSLLVTPKGKKIAIESLSAPIIMDEKGVEGVVMTFNDVSVRRLQEFELRIKDSALETALNGIIIIDMKGKVLYANKSFLQMWRYNDIAAIPKKDSRQLFTSPFSFQKQLQETPQGWIGELTAIRDGNSKFQVLASASTVYDDQQAPLCLMVSFVDITEKKRIEELEKNLKLAEHAAIIKQQFLASMSHEMRTPINGTLVMTDFLLKTELSELQKDYTLTIKKSTENLLFLLNDILDLAKIEAGKIDFRYSSFNICQSLKNAMQSFAREAEQRKIQFKYHFQNNFPEIIYADEKRILQVYKNLLSNALNYTDEGSIASTFSFSETDGREVLIKFEVEDTGRGISNDNLQNLFSKYIQLDESNSRKFDGTGLGLAICKELSELMGGQINVQSQPGKGSKFWFTIKAQRAQVIDISPSESQSSQSSNLKLEAKVLYAEDKFVNQKILTHVLENIGCTVDIAENGQRAVEMARENHYDAIFMDIQMPVMDGIEATRLIRSQNPSSPPIIGLSANVLGSDAEHYINLGLDDYISKPFSTAQIYEKMIKWLGREMNPVLFKDINQGLSDSRVKKADTSSQPVIDPETYKTILKQARQNQELVDQLYLSFIEDGDDLIKSIHTAVKEGELLLFKSSNHALKGLSGTIGASKLFRQTTLTDKLLKEENFQEAMLDVPTISELYQEVRDYIKAKIADL